jgi:hypothetical protein
LTCPATALQDLQEVKEKYEEALQLTVSIGIGMKMSQAFKALLASKLRGKNRTTMYDKEVEKDIEEAGKEEDTERHKIVKEYLAKHQGITHTGEGGTPDAYQVQEASANPEIQAAQDTASLPHHEAPDYESEFGQIATDAENKDQAKKASKSEDLSVLKQKVANSLEAIHRQLPQLAEIKQAAPETYAAVLGVVQGLIAMGRQLQAGDEQLAKAIGSPRRMWVGGGSKIPAMGTPERKNWDNNYLSAVANYFSDGKVHLLKPVKVPVSSLDANHIVSGNEGKDRLYHRMVRAGDKMPPIVVSPKSGNRFKVIDGNRRLEVARANGLTHLDALVPVNKGEVDSTEAPDFSKADLLPGGLADDLRPEDFDAEQLAIGSQHE